MYQTAGVPFTGQFALPADFLRPYQGYGDITYFYFDGRTSFNSLQASVQRRFSRGFSFGASYTLSRATTTVSDDGTFTNNGNPEAFDSGLATFDRTHYLVVNYIWNLPAGGKLLGNNSLARGLLDNWTLSGISWMTSGTPAELALTIAGQDAGNRMLGTYTAGNASGQQPRFYVNGDPQSDPNAINTAAFTVPGINDRGPYPRFNLRNPGFQNHDLSLFKNFPIGSNSKRYAAVPPRSVQRLQLGAVLRCQSHDQRDQRGRTDGRRDLQQLHRPDGDQQHASGRQHVGARVVLRRVQRDPRSAHHPARGEAVFLTRVWHHQAADCSRVEAACPCALPYESSRPRARAASAKSIARENQPDIPASTTSTVPLA